MAQVLTSRAQLLSQAGILVDSERRLTAVPLLLEGYAPNPACLPSLVVALVRDLDWEAASEAQLVAGVASAVAEFYALAPMDSDVGVAPENTRSTLPESGSSDPGSNRPAAMDVDTAQQPISNCPSPAGDRSINASPHSSLCAREWCARHIVFPAMKTLLQPSACRARDGSCLLLTSMERLYRVFERCG